MKIFSFIALAFCFCVFAAYGSALNMTLENDCFLPDKSLGKGDHDYTHGTGIEYVSDDFIHYKVG